MVLAKQKNELGFVVAAILTTLVCCLLAVLPAQAADYNCGVYGVGTYQNNTCADGSLENTGQPLWFLAVPASLILLGTVLLFRATRKTTSPSQSANKFDTN